MTDDAKAHKLADLLERASLRDCERGFGQPYPDVTAVVAGHVIVATLDGGKEYSAPDLHIFTPEQVDDWLRDLRDYRRYYPRRSLSEALHETWPSPPSSREILPDEDAS